MEENIKRDWNETSFRSTNPGAVNEIINGKRRTALQNLARRYHVFSNIALAMIFVTSLPLLRHIPNYIPFAAGCVYFLICTVMDRWLYLGISRIDCATMPISEVARLALFYRKRHLQFMIVLIPIAIMFIGLIAYSMIDNEYFLWGMGVGAVIGLAVGIRQFMEFMADYRDITE